ncbi:hypothetical protein CUTER_01015 [Corynebacterium uterequi]|uniref:Glycosyltransferase RgtA/B/C/D-like domain-containing protein n=2 Tax=Corynebacterium uterequi TaxID=1072256 RepID=A0A0G3HE59_9CORY|nr:hypothetical protein CUTER_01015 [Corynebacterium uterequi]
MSPRGLLTTVVVVGVVIRTWVISRGWFYWDDFILTAEVRSQPLSELLLSSHDGHLMPGSWLLLWAIDALSGGAYSWPVAVAVLAALTAAAAAAFGYAAWTIAPRHAWWITGLYLINPLLLPTSTWLAAAVNSLPLQALAAVWLAHGWRFQRRRRVVDLVVIVVAVVAACLFSERALLLAPVSAVIVLLWVGPGRRGGWAPVVIAFIAPVVAWLAIYLSTVGDPVEVTQRSASLGAIVTSGYFNGFAATLVGGPWGWSRWHPGPPFAAASVLGAALGGAAVVALAAWAYAKRSLAPVAVALAYPLLPLAALYWVRSGQGTAVEIALTLRHFSEVLVLVGLTVAAAMRRSGHRAAGRLPAFTGPAVALAVAGSSLVSVVTYTLVWQDQPARSYFATLTSQQAQQEVTLLDQQLPPEILTPVAEPYHWLSWHIDGVSDYTHTPTVIDAAGAIVPAELMPMRATALEPGCVAPRVTRVLTLDGPLVERDWVLRLNVLAEAVDQVTVALETSEEPVVVDVQPGMQQVHVRLVGGGNTVLVGAENTPLCLGRSEVGQLLPR